MVARGAKRSRWPRRPDAPDASSDIPYVPAEALKCLYNLFRGGLGMSPSLALFHYCEQAFIDIGIYDERTMTAAVARFLAMGAVLDELDGAALYGGRVSPHDPEAQEWLFIIAASQPLIGPPGNLRFDPEAFRQALEGIASV